MPCKDHVTTSILGVLIIGFDHNKDHVVEWTTGLYADPEAKKYFAGVGVHWYGGLNTDKLQARAAVLIIVAIDLI